MSEKRATGNPIGVGDAVPDVTLPDSAGTPVSLASFRARWLVVFFYPAAFSPLCTKEACGFRDEHGEFARAGAAVVGISSDSVERLASFSRMFKLAYPLLSDAPRDGAPTARDRFGVPRAFGVFPGRATYVIDPQGIVRAVYVNSLRARPHLEAALAAIRAG